jgi:hypothetical protein
MDRAREVAAAALAEMFTPAEPAAAPAASPPAPPPVGLTAKLDQPVSRRGFFGAFLRPGDKS